MQILGEVNTVRGSYTFQGRRFEILRDGRIRFDGGDELDPIIDIRARRIISGVETIVRVQGTMRKPELTFSSNPPLEQADILSLIVFNTPVNELGEGQQVSLAAARHRAGRRLPRRRASRARSRARSSSTSSKSRRKASRAPARA